MSERTDGTRYEHHSLFIGYVMLISEIFSSLQGEGPWIGLPAVFIRLAGCVEPLCPWCDTSHALSGGRQMSVDRVMSKVGSYSMKRVVITGGEPFLQWNSGLKNLHAALLAQAYEIQYETSGKVKIPVMKDALIVCSPKHIDGLWRFDESNLDAVDFFKFVSGGEEWFAAIDGFIAAHGIPPGKVYVMPLGASRDEQLKNMEPVFVHCLRRGYRMSVRLQVLIFDTRKGI